MELIQKRGQENDRYPYLAMFLEELELDTAPIKEVMIISLMKDGYGKMNPYAQYLIGGQSGWFVKDEKEFHPLPKGYEITFIQ